MMQGGPSFTYVAGCKTMSLIWNDLFSSAWKSGRRIVHRPPWSSAADSPRAAWRLGGAKIWQRSGGRVTQWARRTDLGTLPKPMSSPKRRLSSPENEMNEESVASLPLAPFR